MDQTSQMDEPDNSSRDTGGGLSRRTVLLGTGAAGALTALPGLPAEAAPAGQAASKGGPKGSTEASGFVTTRGAGFRVGRKPFRFSGTNIYYLHQQSHYMIDAALDDAAAMGLRVVRAWAFADGTEKSAKPLQPEPYTYDDEALDSLDYAVWKAGQVGLRLVLALTNNWPDYGGMQQYVSWFLGLEDDSYADAVNHDRFYTTEAIQRCYQAWVRHVVRRRNPYTGKRYSDDPTIMTFELANEPRNRSDKSGKTLLRWADETSRFVKRLAPQQLVSLGDEGFYGRTATSDYPYSDGEGNHWLDLTALRAIDYGTVHTYPQHWGGDAAADPVGWGTRWISDHLEDARRLRKPVVIEEYGLTVGEDAKVPDEAARTAGYRAWTRAVERGGGSDQFWLLTSRVDDGSFYADYDGYRMTWNADASNPVRDTVAVLSAHAKALLESS